MGAKPLSEKQQTGSTPQPTVSAVAVETQPQTSSDNLPVSNRTLTSSQTLHSDTSATATAVSLLRVKQAVVSIARDPAIPYALKAVDVTDQTIRLGAGQKEELSFSFAAGEKIIFSFEEADGKELNEFEVIEQPAQSRFSAYRSTAIKNKEIVVHQEAIYVFRMRNTSLSK
ncbi:MAG: hypothetical protein EOO04_19315 [Chitinophagaceae bacterium]|nr:MAG: hypothetical protein EOO04_19315 [Chitinophagaceae bacterium]